MKISWWTADALDKIFLESTRPADAPDNIELWAASDETEDAQVAFNVPQDARVQKASFGFSPLKGPRGHRIPSDNCRAYWEWFTFVHANPEHNKDPGTVLRQAPAFFPDAFLEEREIGLRGGVTQPVWISIKIPRDTPPGLYRGAVTFKFEYRGTGAVESCRIPITLHVWPFNLPARPSLHHSEWFSPDILADYYHLERWGEAHWEWIKRVAEDMALHKQDTIATPFSDLVRVVQDKNRRLSFDFRRLDRWLDIFQSAGIPWIKGGHIARRSGNWESPFVYSRWSPVDGSGDPIDTEAMSESEFGRYPEALLKAVYLHLRERGLADRYIQHVADEPIPANAKSWIVFAKRVKRWLPGVPRIDAMGIKGHCEICVPNIKSVLKPVRDTEQIWSYVCMEPQRMYPNRFLDFPSIRNRIIFWLSWTLNLKGFVHWGYNYWHVWNAVPVDVPISPWMDAAGASHYTTDKRPIPAGDPHIVYPGRYGLCSSIRWETVRKGFEDYELLKMLNKEVRHPRRKSSVHLAEARQLLSLVSGTLARDPSRYTHDSALLQTVRRRMGDALAGLMR